jgi:hypothetical protein
VAYQVVTDAEGNIAISGYTLSSDMETLDALQPEWGRGTNLFLTRFKPGVGGKDALGFSTFVGATGTYLPTGLSARSDGSLILVGYGGGGLPVTDNARQSVFFGGSADGFILAVK